VGRGRMGRREERGKARGDMGIVGKQRVN